MSRTSAGSRVTGRDPAIRRTWFGAGFSLGAAAISVAAAKRPLCPSKYPACSPPPSVQPAAIAIAAANKAKTYREARFALATIRVLWLRTVAFASAFRPRPGVNRA